MFGGSFRWAARASLPLALLFILSACGGSTTTTASPAQGVRGTGFTIEAPAGWQVARTTRVVTARRGSALVSVSVFPLVKAYDPAIFDRAARELDGVARRLAERAGGTITESKTTTVDGGKIRAYRFEAKGLQTRVGFVLRGKREYQLLCQASSGDPDGACALLFSSFSAA
jgi:hypothetical protein